VREPAGGEQVGQPRAQVREGWSKAFTNAEANNDRTFISGLYPSWIVADREAYQARLATRRGASHDGTRWWVSHGINDEHCALSTIEHADLLATVEPVAPQLSPDAHGSG